MTGKNESVATAEERLKAVILLLEENGCECDCADECGGIFGYGHDDACEPCFACRVSAVVDSATKPYYLRDREKVPGCTVCGSSRLVEGGEPGACTFIECPAPTADLERET